MEELYVIEFTGTRQRAGRTAAYRAGRRRGRRHLICRVADQGTLRMHRTRYEQTPEGSFVFETRKLGTGVLRPASDATARRW